MKLLKQTLSLLLAIAALTVGQSAWATSSFTVKNTSGTSKFVITRTTNTSTTETVYYRTVSLSAIAGQHFTDTYGSLKFDAEHNSREVEVNENTPTGEAYKYQTTASRKYRFEVVDPGGFYLASCTREISNGLTQFTNSYVNKSITDLVYFQSGSVKSGSGNKYLDVAHSGTNGTEKMIDDGYDYNNNTLCTVSTGNLYNNNSALRSRLNSLGYKMYATVYFQQREVDDGYQYIQILADNASTYDGKDGDGKIDNGPTTSLYKAAFILTKTENVCTSWKYQAFPHKTDNHTSSTEFDYSDSYLYAQAFKSSSYRATTSGSLVLAPTVNDINVRFDANGSGDDTWYLKNLKVRLALVDTKAPTASGTKKVNSGRHSRGNTIYISVPFDEIVVVTGTPTLSTSWGNLSYFDGSGSNVLTFSGTISDTASGALTISGYSGTITDLAGNSLNGTISGQLLTSNYLEGDYPYPITYELNGGTLADGYPSTYTYSAAVSLTNPTRTGYTFGGWTGSNGNTACTAVEIPLHSHGDKSYTANWTTINYNITYDGLDGATFTTSNNSYTIESPDITLDTPTLDGSFFTGWTGSNGDTPQTTVTIPTGSTGNKSYTANWDPIVTYTITYDLAGGNLPQNQSNPVTYTNHGEDITLINPVREGFAFIGWTGSNGDTPQTTVTIPTGSTGNRTFTATWAPISPYYITYNLAGGNLPQGQSNPTEYYNNSPDYTLVNPVRDGYDFAGWTGTGLDAATMDVTIPTGSTGDRAYTATWAPGKPQNLQATANGTTVTLTWDNVSGMQWEVCVNDDETHLTTATTNTCTLQNLTSEDSYLFKVRAVENGTPGEWSDNVTVDLQGNTYIGDKGSDVSLYLPTYGFYEYALSQQIYTTEELGSEGQIQSIAFFNTTQNSARRNLDIYMLHTDKSAFDSNTDWVNVTAADLVFSGPVTFNENAWTSIPLDTPFEYNGLQNVILFVNDKTGEWIGSYPKFLVSSASAQAIYAYKDSQNYDLTNIWQEGTIPSYKNQIKMDIDRSGSAVTRPADLTVSNITPRGATLTWIGVQGYTYNVQYRKADAASWTDYNGTTITNPTCTLAGLEQTTQYMVRVRSVSGENASYWTNTSFTTDLVCPTPTDLACTAYSPTAISLSWTPAGSETEWQICINDDEAHPTTVTTNSFTHTGLTPETKYTYKVRGVVNGDYGFWSDPVTATATDMTVVGNGDNYSTELPTRANYQYTLSQQIYTTTELGSGGSIRSIEFFNSLIGLSIEAKTRNLDIYLLYTNKNKFDSNTDWVNVTADDLVFSGNVTWEEDAWTTINLTTPFEYNGQQNVILCVNDKTGLWGNSHHFLTFNATAQAINALDRNQSYDPTNISATGTILDYKNQIRMFIDRNNPAVTQPTNLTASNITPRGATLTWTGVQGYTYKVQYRKTDVTRWTDISGTIDNPTCTLTGLEQNTQYMVRVQSVSGDGQTSYWTFASFTTSIVCEAPTYLVCTAFSGTAISLSWTPAGSETAWQICVNDDTNNLYDANTNTFTVTGLTLETFYTFKVRGVVNGDYGLWSNPITVESTDKTTIGSGNNTSDELPTDTYYNYTLSQQIYTTAELGSEGLIQSIDFYNTGTGLEDEAKTRNLDIYMLHTDKTTFDSNTDWVNVTAADLVFSGTVTWEENAWTSITLATPFEYNGQQNVILCVKDKSGYYLYGAYFLAFYATSQAMSISTDSQSYDPTNISETGTILDYKNHIRLLFDRGGPAVTKPADLTVSNITPHTATVTWTGTQEGYTYNVQYKKSDAASWTDISGTTTDKTCTLTDLEQGIQYLVRVQSVNEQNTSYWTYTSFTTSLVCPTPADLACTTHTNTSFTLGWTAGSETAWQICVNDDMVHLIDAATNPFTVTNLTSAVSYTFRVRGVVGDDHGLWSEPVTVNTEYNLDKTPIGSGDASSEYLPTNTPTWCSLTEQIYTTDELGTSGLIFSIDFLNTEEESVSRDLDIYMLHTDKTTFDSNTDWVNTTAADLVFSGNVTFNGNDWTTITLDTPFLYNGQQNVILCVNDKTDKKASTLKFSVFETQSSQAIYNRSGSFFDPTNIGSSTGFLATSKNQIRIAKSLALVDNADNTTVIDTNKTKEAIVSLPGRTLWKDGYWNTLCLPFNLTLAGSPLAGAEARALNSASLSGGTLTLTFSDPVTQLTAGTPYIIKWASGDNLVSPFFYGVTISETVHDANFGTVQFKGTYAPINFTDTDQSILFMGADNTLYYPASGAYVNAFRAYFKLTDPNSQVRSFVLNFGSTDDDEDPTAIESLESRVKSQESDVWYTLSGVKLAKKPTRPGIYIHNGKKVLIK